MTLEERVTKLEQNFARLNEAFIQAQKNQVPITAKTDENANNIKTLTPYTETKTGYYGETEKTFYNVPDGNVAVYGLREYTMDRVANNITLTFDALAKETNITVSIL